MLRTLGHWDTNLAEATWLVNMKGSATQPGPTQTKPLYTVEGDNVPALHTGKLLGKSVWISYLMGKGKPICGIVFAQGQKDGDNLECASRRFNLGVRIYGINCMLQEVKYQE